LGHEDSGCTTSDAEADVGTLLFVALATFVPAFLLTAFLGPPKRVLVLGSLLGVGSAMILAAWDPDGPCDPSSGDCDFLLANFTRGDWFILGLVAAALLYLVWMLGVGAGSVVLRRRQDR
jgi:hypothetical protein